MSEIREIMETMPKYINKFSKSQYCNGNDPNCEFLEPTEENQTSKKEPHICKFFNERVYHNNGDLHPFIARLKKCNNLSKAIAILERIGDLKMIKKIIEERIKMDVFCGDDDGNIKNYEGCAISSTCQIYNYLLGE